MVYSPRNVLSSPTVLSIRSFAGWFTCKLLSSAGNTSSIGGDEAVRELSEVFTYFDADGDGKISMADLTGVLNTLGTEISERELRRMMDTVDSDGDGYIDLHDFIRLNTKTVRSTPQAEDELLEAFRLLDTEKGGSITPRGLREMMWRLVGEERTLDDCVLMIKHFDLDGDGVVSFHEFKHMMTATH